MAVNTGYTTLGQDQIDNYPTTGEETVSRDVLSGGGVGGVTLGTQNLLLSYFTARHTGSVASAITRTTVAAAGATPTICRIGIYSVASNGNITLIGSTANDTALWNAINTTYTKALSAPTALTAGSRYAVGLLCVTSAAAPVVLGGAAATVQAPIMDLAPRMTGLVASQSNLPSSVANASITNAGGTAAARHYARLVP